MIVGVAATEMELAPLLQALDQEEDRWCVVTTGVGPMETAIRFCKFLHNNHGRVEAVLQFGVGGAYLQPADTEDVPVLATCLATREVLGDLGITHGNAIKSFPAELGGTPAFNLDNSFSRAVSTTLERIGCHCHRGTFITVNSVSGTRQRGKFLRDAHGGLCENMEGAAVARLCEEMGIPMAELRVISNMVEERTPGSWQLNQAAERAGRLAAMLIKELA